VVLHDVLDDAEPQTRAAGVPAAGRVDPEEALEHPAELLLRNPHALVGHGDLDDAVGVAHPDADVGPRGRVLDGVGDEVVQGRREELLVAVDVQSGRAAGDEPDAVGLGGDPVAVDGAGDQAVDAQQVGLLHHVHRLHPAELDDLLRHPCQAVRLDAQPGGEPAHLVHVLRRALERLGEEPDRADRRLQLVADVGNEVPAHLLEPLRLGVVVGEQQHVAGAEPRTANREMHGRIAERPALHVDLFGDRVVAVPHTVDEVEQLLVCDGSAADEAERERTGRGPHDVVRRVHHDAGRLERLEHLVHSVRHPGGGHGDRPIPALRGHHHDDDDERAEDDAHRQRHGHQPGGVHSD
jgi:hypothetical protein